MELTSQCHLAACRHWLDCRLAVWCSTYCRLRLAALPPTVLPFVILLLNLLPFVACRFSHGLLLVAVLPGVATGLAVCRLATCCLPLAFASAALLFAILSVAVYCLPLIVRITHCRFAACSMRQDSKQGGLRKYGLQATSDKRQGDKQQACHRQYRKRCRRQVARS